jgi:hypothetical protein
VEGGEEDAVEDCVLSPFSRHGKVLLVVNFCLFNVLDRAVSLLIGHVLFLAFSCRPMARSFGDGNGHEDGYLSSDHRMAF